MAGVWKGGKAAAPRGGGKAVLILLCPAKETEPARPGWDQRRKGHYK